MLLVQEYLKTKTFGELAKEYGVYASFSKTGHKWSMNYDQIEARESDSLSQQCRGLILATNTGASLISQAKEVNGRLNYDHICPGETMIIANPMTRFFNHGQGSAANINWSDPNLRVMEKLDGCFTYDTLLTCWDSSVLRIGEIVKNKLTPKLIGMNEDGELVPCQITNWFNNGKKDNWLEITTDEISKTKNRKFKITSNHSVNINNKFTPIMNAKIGDKLISWENNICDWTKHFIKSSLLGDATLSLNGINYKYEEVHKKDHSEFSEQNIKWLGENFSNKGIFISGFGSKMIRVSSKPDSIISELRKEWYTNEGIKVLPKDLSWIDNFTIAKWYMDDGSLAHDKNQKDRALFATNNFSEEEVIRLGEKLKEMYNISFTVYFSKGWCLRVNAGRNLEIDKMWKAISTYIIPCMRYKLPIEYREQLFIDNNKSGVIKKVKKEIEILDIKPVDLSINNKKEFPHGRSGFDIETTTHNYIANNILVHNSLCIVYHDPFTHQWCVATRSVPEADIPLDNGLFTFRTLFEKSVTDSLNMSFSDLTKKLNPWMTYCFELTTPYNRIVVQYESCSITLLAVKYCTSGTEVDLESSEVTERYPFLPRVKVYALNTADEIVNWVSEQNPLQHEGVVVMDSKFNRIKVKNASYVAFSKARDVLGTSMRNCLELVLAEKDDDVMAALPPEIVKSLVDIKAGVKTLLVDYDTVYSKILLDLEKANASSKKDFALCLVANRITWQAPFFQMYDKKAANMREFVAKNRKDGSWGNGFLDKILEILQKNGSITGTKLLVEQPIVSNEIAV